jgi:hypothetical protein
MKRKDFIKSCGVIGTAAVKMLSIHCMYLK